MTVQKSVNFIVKRSAWLAADQNPDLKDYEREVDPEEIYKLKIVQAEIWRLDERIWPLPL